MRHDADRAFGEPLDALRPMRLADLGAESPDEDDRGGRVDRGVESESEQRQAVGCQPDDDRGTTEQSCEHDAQDGETEGSMEQVMAVHGSPKRTPRRDGQDQRPMPDAGRPGELWQRDERASPRRICKGRAIVHP